MKEFTTAGRLDAAEVDYPLEFRIDGVEMYARRPKDAVLARFAGISTSRYARGATAARAAFELVEASLKPESLQHVLDRLHDERDSFGNDEFVGIFEWLIEQFAAEGEAEPANRSQRRAAARS